MRHPLLRNPPFSGSAPTCLFCLALGVVPVAAQSQANTKNASPIVTCSDATTQKACRSFKQLVDAHDADILDRISAPPLYVCFRPDEDSFLMISFREPRKYLWKQAKDSTDETQLAFLRVDEYRDGVSRSFKTADGVWRRYRADTQPFMEIDMKDGFKGTVSENELVISYPFKNQEGGMTQHSLSLRRSTGRFMESFTIVPSTNSFATASGSCLIYR